MNEIIKEQILSIRESGVTNMFDVDRMRQMNEGFMNW